MELRAAHAMAEFDGATKTKWMTKSCVNLATSAGLTSLLNMLHACNPGVEGTCVNVHRTQHIILTPSVCLSCPRLQAA